MVNPAGRNIAADFLSLRTFWTDDFKSGQAESPGPPLYHLPFPTEATQSLARLRGTWALLLDAPEMTQHRSDPRKIVLAESSDPGIGWLVLGW